NRPEISGRYACLYGMWGRRDAVRWRGKPAATLGRAIARPGKQDGLRPRRPGKMFSPRRAGHTPSHRIAGLEGVGPPVHKEAEVVRHHTGWRFQTKLPHFLLPEVRWAPHVHNVEWCQPLRLGTAGHNTVGNLLLVIQPGRNSPLSRPRSNWRSRGANGRT